VAHFGHIRLRLFYRTQAAPPRARGSWSRKGSCCSQASPCYSRVQGGN
jgi:hypothetical protein